MAEGADTRAARADMATEARAIIDLAREQGLTLRLLGGLAVREHCAELAFCDRDYQDLDMAGRKRDAAQLTRLFSELGYERSIHVSFATRGRQLQFSRPCRHCPAGHCLHEDDHVDVFLDTFKMDHEIDLREGLDAEPYTLTLGDTLLTKLQIFEPGDKDLRDIVTLLKDVEIGDDDAPGTVSSPAIARRCATDWGLYHDVELNLGRVLDTLPEYGLDDEEAQRVRERIGRLQAALTATPKSFHWRLRARVGEKRPWHNVVEEQGEEEF